MRVTFPLPASGLHFLHNQHSLLADEKEARQEMCARQVTKRGGCITYPGVVTEEDGENGADGEMRLQQNRKEILVCVCVCVCVSVPPPSVPDGGGCLMKPIAPHHLKTHVPCISCGSDVISTLGLAMKL